MYNITDVSTNNLIETLDDVNNTNYNINNYQQFINNTYFFSQLLRTRDLSISIAIFTIAATTFELNHPADVVRRIVTEISLRNVLLPMT